MLKNADTVAIERFERSDVTWRGTLALATKKDVADSWSVVTAPDGTVPLVEVMESQKPPDPRMKARVISRARIIMKGDSVSVDQMTPNGLVTRLFRPRLEQCPTSTCHSACSRLACARRRLSAQKDSLGLKVYFFNLGGGQTVRGTLVQNADGKAVLSIGEIKMDLVLAPDGRLLSVAIPAQGLRAERVQ